MTYFLWSSYLSQRNNMRLEKMWMLCAEASPALVKENTQGVLLNNVPTLR